MRGTPARSGGGCGQFSPVLGWAPALQVFSELDAEAIACGSVEGGRSGGGSAMSP